MANKQYRITEEEYNLLIAIREADIVSINMVQSLLEQEATKQITQVNNKLSSLNYFPTDEIYDQMVDIHFFIRLSSLLDKINNSDNENELEINEPKYHNIETAD